MKQTKKEKIEEKKTLKKQIIEAKIKISRLNETLEKLYFWVPLFSLFYNKKKGLKLKNTLILGAIYVIVIGLFVYFSKKLPSLRMIGYILISIIFVYFAGIYFLDKKILHIRREIKEAKIEEKELKKK